MLQTERQKQQQQFCFFFLVPFMKKKLHILSASVTHTGLVGTMQPAANDTAIPQLQSLDEINLSVPQDYKNCFNW